MELPKQALRVHHVLDDVRADHDRVVQARQRQRAVVSVEIRADPLSPVVAGPTRFDVDAEIDPNDRELVSKQRDLLGAAAADIDDRLRAE
jgi:hypothetical protein